MKGNTSVTLGTLAALLVAGCIAAPAQADSNCAGTPVFTQPSTPNPMPPTATIAWVGCSDLPAETTFAWDVRSTDASDTTLYGRESVTYPDTETTLTDRQAVMPVGTHYRLLPETTPYASLAASRANTVLPYGHLTLLASKRQGVRYTLYGRADRFSFITYAYRPVDEVLLTIPGTSWSRVIVPDGSGQYSVTLHSYRSIRFKASERILPRASMSVTVTVPRYRR